MNSTATPTVAGTPGRRRRIPPNLFGIPFGIAGMADVWATAAPTLGISRAVADAIDIFAAGVWVVIVALYFSQGRARLASDARDPVVGPFVALSVIAPILPAVTLSDYAFEAGRAVIVVLVALTVLFGAWLTGQWIVGQLDQDKLHPGYLLPTVAGGLISAYAAAAVDMRALAEALFGWGIVSWLLLGSLIMGRRFIRPALPPALIPSHAIEAAPRLSPGSPTSRSTAAASTSRLRGRRRRPDHRARPGHPRTQRHRDRPRPVPATWDRRAGRRPGQRRERARAAKRRHRAVIAG